jgi:hypothetical protein
MPWSNGQAEGQNNRLKTLKRAMYGRGLCLELAEGPNASVPPHRLRMIPFKGYATAGLASSRYGQQRRQFSPSLSMGRAVTCSDATLIDRRFDVWQ